MATDSDSKNELPSKASWANLIEKGGKGPLYAFALIALIVSAFFGSALALAEGPGWRLGIGGLFALTVGFLVAILVRLSEIVVKQTGASSLPEAPIVPTIDKLYTLRQCLEDAIATINKSSDSREARVLAVAINMEDGWENLVAFL